MYRCYNCGRQFENPVVFKEYMGECHGFKSYEEVDGCPYCYGEYEEIKEDEDDESENKDESEEEGDDE